MNPVIVICGANGFLGRYLSRYFAQQGKEVVCIARSREGWSGDGMFLEWNGRDSGPWELALEGAELVINLAGRSVNCRYTPENRAEILRSRVASTAAIGCAIRRCKIPPRCWMNSATATWYRHATDRPQDEWTGEPGEGFSVDVARKWEEAFFGEAVPPETRKIALRAGMILACEPGTVLEKLRDFTIRGLGGAMGPGNQRVSWLHMEDFLRAVSYLASEPLLSGIFNLTAPDHPTNREFMSAIREATGIPLGLPATAWMIRAGAVLMKTEAELVLKSRWVSPTRLRDEGFRWRWPDCCGAVADLMSRKGLEEFFRNQEAHQPATHAWLPAAHQ